MFCKNLSQPAQKCTKCKFSSKSWQHLFCGSLTYFLYTVKGYKKDKPLICLKALVNWTWDEDVYENRHCQQKQGVCRNVKLNLNRFCLSKYMLIVGIVGSKPNDK